MGKYIILITSLVLFVFYPLQAQNETKVPPYCYLCKEDSTLTYVAQKKAIDNSIYTIVDETPKPIGGFSAYYDYLDKNLKYPESLRNQSIEGTVIIQFVIEKDGSFSNFKTLKGINPGLDKEALRVLKASNTIKWTRGKNLGKVVRTIVTVPVKFRLTR